MGRWPYNKIKYKTSRIAQRRVQRDSVEPTLTQNFIFTGNFENKFGIPYLPEILTPLILYLILLFSKSIYYPGEWQTVQSNQRPRSVAYDLDLHCLLRPICPNTLSKNDNTLRNHPGSASAATNYAAKSLKMYKTVDAICVTYLNLEVTTFLSSSLGNTCFFFFFFCVFFFFLFVFFFFFFVFLLFFLNDCSDCPYLIRTHLSFCFCVMFPNISPKILFTAKIGPSYAISIVKRFSDSFA